MSRDVERLAGLKPRPTYCRGRISAAAVALYFMWYNFGRVHQTLRVAPAMEAGIANHVWSIEDIIGLPGV